MLRTKIEVPKLLENLSLYQIESLWFVHGKQRKGGRVMCKLFIVITFLLVSAFNPTSKLILADDVTSLIEATKRQQKQIEELKAKWQFMEELSANRDKEDTEKKCEKGTKRDTGCVLDYGLIPNNSAEAGNNSVKLARMRANFNCIHWCSVRNKKEPEFTFWYLEEGVDLISGEHWTGCGRLTQLYFNNTGPSGALVRMNDYSSVNDLSLIHIGAFNAGIRSGVGITDGPNIPGGNNGQRWRVENVSVQWCEDAVQLNQVWIVSFLDLYCSNNVNGIHLAGGNNLIVEVRGGEIGGNNTGYGILIDGNANDCKFDGVTIEGNASGGVLHTGPNSKRNVIYDGCYFESNGPLHILIDGEALIEGESSDIGTKIHNCGFHDDFVTSYEIRNAFRCDIAGNFHNTAPPEETGSNGLIGAGSQQTQVHLGTAGGNTASPSPITEVVDDQGIGTVFY